MINASLASDARCFCFTHFSYFVPGIYPETKSQEFFSKFSKKVLILCRFPVFGLRFKIDLAVRSASNMIQIIICYVYEKGFRT